MTFLKHFVICPYFCTLLILNIPGSSDSQSVKICEFEEGDGQEKFPTALYQLNKPSKTGRFYCQFFNNKSWIVIQRRLDGSENFARNWNEYKNGFGDQQGEFWLGNDLLNQLTRNQEAMVRFDLWNEKGAHNYAEYEQFRVADGSDKYRLHIKNYKGNTGDAMKTHDKMRFSTHDQDNDRWLRVNGSCSRVYDYSGWWFNDCVQASLNGKYLPPGTSATPTNEGIVWYKWTIQSLKKTEIKISFNSDRGTIY